MKKKIFSLVATLSLLSSCSVFEQNKLSSSPISSVPEVKLAPFSYSVLSANTIKITGYNPKDNVNGSKVEIPSTIDGWTVVEIAENAFANQDSIQKVTIPTTVTKISANAFLNCTSLETVELPTSVTEIGEAAFKGCSLLSKISLHDGITKLGQYAFTNCSSLSEITIPNNSSITKLEAFTFSGCSSLKKIIVPDNVTSLEKHAFSDCTNLVDITLPTTLKTIGDSAFSNCTSLEFVDLNDNLEYVYSAAFYNCVSLESITIPTGTVIANNAFSNCNFSSIALPSDLTEITKSNLSRYLSGITGSDYKLEIPATVTSIDTSALDSLSNIKEISVSTKNPKFSSKDGILYNKDQTELWKCPLAKDSINEIASTVITIKNGAFYNCTKLTEISLPKSVKTIEAKAFENCSSVTNFTIPLSVVSISESFFGCTSLERIDCEAALKPYDWVEGWSNIKNNTSALVNWNSKENSQLISGIYYTIDNVDSSYAIVSGYVADTINSTSEILEEVTFYGKKYTVQEIKKGAFNNCDKIQTIIIPDTIEVVNEKAFEGCTSLICMIIPKSVKVFKSTFADCRSLVHIYLEASEENIAEKMENGDFAKNFNVISDIKTIECGYDFKPKIFEVNDVTYTLTKRYQITVKIEESKRATFSSNLNLAASQSYEGVSYPVTTIEDDAFNGCVRLSTIDIPDTVIEIGDRAFSNTKIATIEFKGAITKIGDNSFTDIPSLKYISMKNSANYMIDNEIIYERNGNNYKLLKCPEGKAGSVTVINECNEIRKEAFINCTRLTSISLNNSITKIDDSTFENCSSLTSFTIPSSITSIGTKAFKNCSLITAIRIPQAVISIADDTFESMLSLGNITVESNNTNYASLNGLLYSKDYSTLYRCPETISGTVTLAPELQYIKVAAFSGCLSISKYEISETNETFYTSPTTGILYNAFKSKVISCPKGFEGEIVFESTTTNIQEGSFKDCSKITKIDFAENIVQISDGEFYDCTSLNNIYIGQYFVTNNANLSKYFLVDNITTLGLKSNIDYEDDGSVTYSSTPIKKTLATFKNVTNLLVEANNKKIKTEGGILFSYNMKTIISSIRKLSGEVTVSSTVVKIESNAFEGTAIDTLIIPSTVTVVRSNIVLNSSVTSILCGASSRPLTWSSATSSDGAWADETGASGYTVEWGVSIG